MLAGSIVQSVMFTGNSGAIAFAIDIEMGFTDRLFAAPISRYVGGPRAAGGDGDPRGADRRSTSSSLGLIFGASVHEGIPGGDLDHRR